MLAGKFVRQACERHLRDLKEARQRGLHYDRARAWRAICFFRTLKLTKSKWAKQHFELQPWQCFVTASIWGWRKADGTRRFRKAYIEIPRKNGKTEYAGGALALGGFHDDPPEYGAENYAAATKRDQAKLVFNASRTMLKRAPNLRAQLTFTVKRITRDETGSYIEPLGRDSENLDGLNPHFTVIDELHAHANSGIVDVLESATGARAQSFELEITTAGAEQVGVCWEHHDYSVNLLDPASGWKDDGWFAYIAAADDGDPWDDPRTWRKANPNFGVTIAESWFTDRLPGWRKSASARREMMRKNLDLWVGGSKREIDLTVWDRGKEPIDVAALKKRPCFAGLDIGLRNDPSSLGLVWPPTADDKRWVIMARHWIPEGTIEQLESEHRVPWRHWVKEGLVTATPGDAVDDAFIEHEVADLLAAHGIRELAYDRYKMESLQTRLQDRGLTIVAFGQGFASMSDPTDKFLKLYLSGLLQHGGNHVLRWMASNLTIRRDPSGNLKPDKEKSRDKIDGIVAVIMALGRAMVAPPPAEPSLLEKHAPFDI